MISKQLIVSLAFTLCAGTIAAADSLLVGFNTQTPLQVYSTNGAYQQDFGPAGASAGIEESGLLYVVLPNTSGTTSTVEALNAAQQVVSHFTVNDLISDGAPGQGGTLWLAGYDGMVYQVSASSGAVLSSFNTGYGNATSIGIASNGSTLYTTEGDTSDGIDVRNTSGAIQSTIHTGYSSLYGLAYDSANSSLYAGTFSTIYDFSLSGSLLTTLDVPGDKRTPNGAIHDGLELGDLSTLQSPTPPPPTVPEPRLGWLSGLLLAGLVCPKRVRGRLMEAVRTFPAMHILAVVAVLSLGRLCFASVNVSVTPAVPDGARVGTTIRLNASASDTASSSATFTYQFSIGLSGQPLTVVRDFYTFNYFPWTPGNSEGSYEIQVVVHSSTGATGIGMAAYHVTPIATSSPVVSPTSHPLVALYSMPPCTAGHTARVRFKLPTDSSWHFTTTKTCDGQTTLNFYVAGMLANTTYQLQQDVFNGPFDTPGPVLSFTTGSLPAGVFPGYSTAKQFVAPTNTSYPVLLNALTPPGVYSYATDTTTGKIIWYLPVSDVVVTALDRPVNGGTFLTETTDGTSGVSKLFREYDLGGNLVRETNTTAINQQLTGPGAAPLTSLHHDAVVLGDGGVALIGSVEKVANQGAGPVDVLGDEIVVLDSNFKLKWWWNEFNHFPISRPAILGETCTNGQQGCPPVTNPSYKVANDWTHTNSIWQTSDGNLIISMRHQDWVVKIPYEGGSGPADGPAIWTLGLDGNFKVVSSDPYPWFSHQHHAEVQANGLLTIFDDGNTRICGGVHECTSGNGNSRGQAWTLDEKNLVATLSVNIDLGQFSFATGSAELLSNGNYTFDLGFLNNLTTSSTKEYNSSGSLVSEQDVNRTSYRTFRMVSLYQAH